jgi:hypothetical protein
VTGVHDPPVAQPPLYHTIVFQDQSYWGGIAASDSGELVKRFERFLDFRACPLIIGRDSRYQSFAINVSSFVVMPSSGEHFPKMIVSGNVSGISIYYLSKLQHGIGFFTFLL